MTSVRSSFCSSYGLLLCCSVALFLCSFLRSSVTLLLFSFVPTVFVFWSIHLMMSVRSSYMSHEPKCCGLRRRSHNKFWPLWSMTHIVVDKSVIQTTLNCIRFVLPQYLRQKNVFRFLKAWPRAWHIELDQRCLDFYRQRQISQPDCETSSKLPGLTDRELIYGGFNTVASKGHTLFSLFLSLAT